MKNKIKKSYTLNDIEIIFTFTPALFIIILATLTFVSSYLVIDFKKIRKIDLIQQKRIINNEFEKKDFLYSFINNIKKEVDGEFSDVKIKMRQAVYKVIGHLETIKTDINDKQFMKYLKNIENKHSVNVVIFRKSNLSISHGENIINELHTSLFNENNKKYKKLLLQYIYSQGKNNLQYWRYDLEKSLILSFFDIYEIDNKEYYIGSFSKINNISYLTKNLIVEKIKLMNKNDDYSFWFLNLINSKVFNYENNNKYLLSKNIKYETNIKNEVLKYYEHNYKINTKFNKYVYFDKKYSYILSINYKSNNYEIESKIKQIIEEYDIFFLKIAFTILILTIILIIFSILFSKFIKKIFASYNNELRIQTKKLTNLKKRFELAIIASKDGLWDIDFTNDTIYFSQQWLNMFGYEKDDLNNFNDWFNLVHKNDKNEVSKRFDNILLENNKHFICEYRLKTKSGQYKWILARGKLFVDKNTNEKRMLMMSMDIDNNKRMSKELLDVEVLVEDGRMVIFKCNNDENLNFNYISNSIKSYGYDKDIFINNNKNFIGLVIEKDKDKLKNAIFEAIQKNEKSFSLILKIKNAKSEERWIFLRTILLHDDLSDITELYGYFYDISKIKISEEELKQKVQLEVNKNINKDKILIQQNKLASMGEMLGNIAHQWRQPLNTVNLIIHFIRDNYENKNFTKEQLEKYINKSKIQIDYMSQTIDDFRNFYKTSKKINSFNIAETVNDVLKILKDPIELNGIEISLNVQNITVNNYENELKQSLLNIINNAKDAIIKKSKNEEFKAIISIDITKQDYYAQICIKNNGYQIKKEILDKIFEPYFTTKFETQGTGIGLYMSRTIIETNMNGKISVTNVSDGVLFTIDIPL